MKAIAMKQRTLVLSAAVCAAALLIVPVWPHFLSGAIVAPYQDTLREFARGNNVHKTVLAETEAALRVSRDWIETGQASVALGGMRFIAARSAQSAAAQRGALDDSISALKQGLSRKPAQPYAWLQLAQAERARNGATPAIESYLTVSMRLAPWEHRLVLPRLEVALGAWPALSESFKVRLPPQFARAVDTAPLALAEATRRNFALRAVRRMFADSPVHLERFLIVYLSPD